MNILINFDDETTWHAITLIILLILYHIIYCFCKRRLKNRSEVTYSSINSCLSLFEQKLGKNGFVILKNQGIRLHYVTSGDEINPMMLMIHGHPEFWHVWKNQILEFCENYWLVIPDLRGYGLSDRSNKNVSIINLVEDMEELITLFAKDPAIVVGHGFGGIIACTLAENHPDVVNRLVILDAPFPGTLIYSNTWWITFEIPIVLKLFIILKRIFFMEKIFKENENKDIILNEMEAYCKEEYGMIGMNHFVMKSREIDKEIKISLPTLIIWGENDFLDYYTCMRNYYKYCNDLRTERVGNAGHWVHCEQPEIVNASITKFLKETEKVLHK
ncbi:epoxide hydrolase 3-like [Centruroides vittatus]|uniref:epoxide hydrolase 3-like n=1 Tax=Centruroides vittatus TaxID=120091 RepID=UPI003510123A